MANVHTPPSFKRGKHPVRWRKIPYGAGEKIRGDFMPEKFWTLDDAVSPVLSGQMESLKVRLCKHHVNIYRVRGKGKDGRDVIRVDITPNYYKDVEEDKDEEAIA
jgi:hypothetical protein